MTTPPKDAPALVLHDRIDPWQIGALHATLDLPGAAPGVGDPLPPLWHFVQFREARPRSDLGGDGHPKLGGFIPDFGLPRRMWAGGRLTFLAPLLVGDAATRRSTVLKTALKDGRSGRLAFVTVLHEITGPAGLAIREEQDIVYREAHDPDAPARAAPPPAPQDAAWMAERAADPTLLFRYSALTFNGHRIHYDLDHARHTEGYDGLVVHGPLLAQCMADLARTCEGRPLAAFSFRAVSPVTHGAGFAICGMPDGTDAARLWVRGPGGGLAMEGTAQFA
ncbi:MAG: 3-methylfumaryl-CoA hydratase [Paracoccaceae bacterium]|jgi:3-methylfumaryl-CoA hydratase